MKYIPAEKLIAEIERLKDKYPSWQLKLAMDDLYDFITSLQQEQTEVPNGKFVFPKYLYARTKDNKTIDMSYAPQDMNAIEYIRNDFIQQEMTEGLHFTPLNRLIQKVPSKNWNETVNNYAKKLRDCLIKEGYLKDAEVLQGYISYMNGNNVPMATMDMQEQPKVDFEKLGGIARHLIAVKDHEEDMRLDESEWLLLERIGYPERFNTKKED